MAAPSARALWALLSLGCWAPVRSLDNGLARLPYMGYNTWYDFQCAHINASNVMKLADALVGHGFASLGYNYLALDDCWATSRDTATHVIEADRAAFPDGMKKLVDYVHSKGLKFGIYTDRGTATCAGRPGSLGYEDVDARTYAEWGVDLVKEDSCNAPSNHSAAFAEYGAMRDALNRTGRPMVFNLCGWSSWYAPEGARLGNSWRIGGDGQTWESVVDNALVNAELSAYAGPGGWNDPDFLLGSSPHAAAHLTPTQSRMQFSLWAVMTAPLVIGSNLLHLSAFDAETYANEEVIAVNQDASGVQGTVVEGNCPKRRSRRGFGHGRARPELARKPPPGQAVPHCQQIWAKPLAGGDRAVVFANFGAAPANVTCGAACFERMGYRGGRRPAGMRDLWRHAEVGFAGGAMEVSLAPSGGFAMYRLTGTAAGGTAAARTRPGRGAPVVEPRGAPAAVVV